MSLILYGSEYDFLGMKLKFEDKKVRINIKTYLKKVVEDFEEKN